MRFELVTPEKLMLSIEATYVTVPGSEGEFGVLEGHMPLVSTLQPGRLSVETPDGTQHFNVTEGFAEVTANSVTVLTEKAEATH